MTLNLITIILFNDKDEILVEHPTNHSPNFWSMLFYLSFVINYIFD